VLSEEEKAQVHERSLAVLATTGVKVNTAKGRQFLRDAGAEIDSNSNIVKFPRAVIEESLRLAPKEFTLDARRPGWDLPGKKDLLEEARETVEQVLSTHEPPALSDEIEKELDRIQQRADRYSE
jgi:trimethylamine:corrinoid methyltransferase-like protein